MQVEWEKVRDYADIIFEKANYMGKITINRPEVRNAFRPETLTELIDAFNLAREDPQIGVVILTGAGDKAFCSGGDQRVRGHGGYVGDDGVPRLNALDLQKVIKYLPKPVIAMVAGYAIGGGHVLHLLCDLTIAADNARFGQTGPKVGSFDAGWGATYMARVVGHKKAVRSGISAASTQPRRPSTWDWSTPSCPWNAWKKRPYNGPASYWRKARLPCASSKRLSTRTPTASPVFKNWLATPPCSTT